MPTEVLFATLATDVRSGSAENTYGLGHEGGVGSLAAESGHCAGPVQRSRAATRVV
jgi:hypothetical protein